MKQFLILFMVIGLTAGPVATAGANTTAGRDRTALAKLVASDAMPSDRFGVSAAVSGDTALIGAPIDDAERGAAYVFTRVDGAWVQQAKLVASDGRSLRKFGYSVALSGDTAVVGNTTGIIGGSDVHADPTPGSAYVFQRVGKRWIEQAKLTAGSDGSTGDDFGYSVAVSGDTVVVGASGIGVGGAAYVFVRAGRTWRQQAKLTPVGGAVGDKFGFSVAASGGTVVVGARVDDVGPSTDQGSAYVFSRNGARWIQQAKLTASDGAATDEFGFSVGASAETVVVGALFNDVKSPDQGSAYVFVRSGGGWRQQARLTAGDGSSGDLFGRSTAVSGDTVIVGAQADNSGSAVDGNRREGSAYVFKRRGATWAQHTKLTAAEGLFSVSAAISGGTAVIGAPFENGSRGAAYVWEDRTTCHHRR